MQGISSRQLTAEHVGGSIAILGLCRQIAHPVAGGIADGAFDGQLIADVIPSDIGSEVEVIVSPPKDAVAGNLFAAAADLGW